MARYIAKRDEVTGTWNVHDTKRANQVVDQVGVNMHRSAARKYAFLLNNKRMVIERRNPLSMPHTGIPGSELLKKLEREQEEAAENFKKNKRAILAGIREQERLDESPINMKGW